MTDKDHVKKVYSDATIIKDKTNYRTKNLMAFSYIVGLGFEPSDVDIDFYTDKNPDHYYVGEWSANAQDAWKSAWEEIQNKLLEALEM
jgi:hypothetical protein